MKAPFIVYEHGDLRVYRALGDLELALEPIDVSSDEYACYDAEGTVVHLRIERVARRGFLREVSKWLGRSRLASAGRAN